MENYSKEKYPLDSFLITIIVALIAISCFTLYTLQDFLPGDISGIKFSIRQIIWFLVGSMGVAAIMILDFDWYRKIAWGIYGFGVFLLAGLFFLPWSSTLNGATRWYEIAGQTIQPSEFMKVFFVVGLAHMITSHNEKWTKKNLTYDLVLLAKLLAMSLPPFVLIALQPDLGSALVIVSITGFLTLISGIRWRTLLTIFGLAFGTLAVIVVLYLTNTERFIALLMDSPFDHVAYRIQAWQNPHLYSDGSAMQAIKSMLAIGSGQLFGKGIMGFEVYIPERHTDMIFTAVAEQFGFIGASVVIVLYFLMIYRIIKIALDSKDPFGTYLCVGMVGLFSYQIFQNIGMSVQLLPLTGIPLPFLSYGGTSLLVYMAAIGLVLNIHSRKREFMFESEQ
ncbi:MULTISPECIES: FtsW/RodA/SpoVE family cell cycle protein [Allobacillus]|uniref:Rod shape-determining protein RodA n=1 Tax=Allobacillus halotolerans TaxID=570278 RepID=A0ABS6GQW8_9BACI|nr:MULTISPECIES: FtsW/RodA/SpoVE family cell cycle protein [Allobacillus]MBU6081509.1 rod shape-determining protein RodA [Allobacillus halotolerans]TSJ69466.1 rod shape-determining protein RodA [Allobacillus sp. SKP2-8]